jgi:hypothetical protein
LKQQPSQQTEKQTSILSLVKGKGTVVPSPKGDSNPKNQSPDVIYEEKQSKEDGEKSPIL